MAFFWSATNSIPHMHLSHTKYIKRKVGHVIWDILVYETPSFPLIWLRYDLSKLVTFSIHFRARETQKWKKANIWLIVMIIQSNALKISFLKRLNFNFWKNGLFCLPKFGFFWKVAKVIKWSTPQIPKSAPVRTSSCSEYVVLIT